MEIKNVAVVGANGSLGSQVVRALLAANRFRVTVVKRQSSKSTTSGPVRILEVSDAWSVDELRKGLAGEDAVIICSRPQDVDQHLRLADAAAAVGVRRFIPADFGSVDSRSEHVRQLVKLFEGKLKVRERLEALCADSGGKFTWTSLVPGHMFDWGLTNGFLHFDLEKKTAEILGDGMQKSSTATLEQISKAVIRVLEKPEETKNRVLMIQSFCVSQLEVLRSLEKATDSQWSVEHLDADSFIAKHKALADAGHRESNENLVFALGVVDGNWETKEDFAMELLGLQNEDLDEVVRKIVGTV